MLNGKMWIILFLQIFETGYSNSNYLIQFQLLSSNITTTTTQRKITTTKKIIKKNIAVHSFREEYLFTLLCIWKTLTFIYLPQRTDVFSWELNWFDLTLHLVMYRIFRFIYKQFFFISFSRYYKCIHIL